MTQFYFASFILLWIVVLFNLMLTLALINRIKKMNNGLPDFEDAPGLEPGTQAPDFNAETLDGEIVNLATYSQQARVFIFISPTCEPCIEKIPFLHTVASRAEQHHVNVILVIMANRLESRTFVDDHSIKLPVIFSPVDSAFSKDYKVSGTPFYCLVDRGNNVQASGFLDSNWEELIQKWTVKK